MTHKLRYDIESKYLKGDINYQLGQKEMRLLNNSLPFWAFDKVNQFLYVSIRFTFGVKIHSLSIRIIP